MKPYIYREGFLHTHNIIDDFSQMRNILLAVLLMLVSLMGVAQEKKKEWVPPKRPKLIKWEPPVQEDPELIDEWRPYFVSDNWMLDFTIGGCLSLAENMAGQQLKDVMLPHFEMAFGKQFSRLWSTRFTIGFGKQVACASDKDILENPVLGNGRYSFSVVELYVDEMFSLTKFFCPYNEKRKLDIQLVAGVGGTYSWGFSDKTIRWQRLGYPIDRGDHLNVAFRGGLLMLLKVREATDLYFQGMGTWTGDSYNGVKHSPSFALDPFLHFSLGVRVHLPDHYGDYRYRKVRRAEMNYLRGSTPRIANYIDNERRQEFAERESQEVVAFGQNMKTRISFYVDRTFVNDMQMENIRIVADFLEKHPEVNLIIRGYSGASHKEESPTMHLAEKRVVSVKKALVKYYNVDPSRLETSFDEEAESPYRLTADWIDAVVFEMKERAGL